MKDYQWDVISFGRVAVDLYSSDINVPLKDAEHFNKYLGGSAGNIAVGTSRLGLKSAMLSCVGADDMGTFVKEQLEREGVDTSLLRVIPDHLTGLVLLGVEPPDRFPLIFYRNDCADMQVQAEQASEQQIASAKSMVFTGTGFSSDAMHDVSLDFIDKAKRAGTKLILDIDYRPVLWNLTSKGDGESRYQRSAHVTSVLQEILPEMDLIVGTQEEIAIAGGDDDWVKALKQIRANCAATIVVKTGAEGCQIYREDEVVTVPGIPTTVLNVLGAGDAFMSGFLYGWLRDQPLHDCGLYANACGSIVVWRHGCSVAIPHEQDMLDFLKGGQDDS